MGRFAIFCADGPGNVDTNGLHYCDKTYNLHAACPMVLDTRSPVEFRHGHFDSSSESVLNLE